MQIPVYNKEAKAVRNIDVPERIAKTKWKPDLVHQVVVSMLSTKRSGTAHAKGRGDVRGGGRKPWKQKGTGRARHGSIRSPIWIGGGVTHGPIKDKDYTRKINKKMRRTALHSVLQRKIADAEIVLVEALPVKDGKTKEGAAFLKTFADAKVIDARKTALVLLEKPNSVVMRSLRNLPKVEIGESRNLNALDATTHRYLIFTEQAFHGII